MGPLGMNRSYCYSGICPKQLIHVCSVDLAAVCADRIPVMPCSFSALALSAPVPAHSLIACQNHHLKAHQPVVGKSEC